MIISMQGNWTVTVKSKKASYKQQFIVQGADTGNGVYEGKPGISANVTGEQWSIAIQNKKLFSDWQLSKTQIKFPTQQGGNYQFEIWSDDMYNDEDFNDLILTCSTPANINDFIIYGNVTLYSGRCTFNPCRKFPFVIETYPGLLRALKNPFLREYIEEFYPERIPTEEELPEPPWLDPDPGPYFKPLVFDVSDVATQPNTLVQYAPKAIENPSRGGSENEGLVNELAASNFTLVSKSLSVNTSETVALAPDRLKVVENIESLFSPCINEAGSNLTLTFEEYDRTISELAGSGYTGNGNRRLLGDTITDMNGNYIFRFSFDMTFPELEDASDIAPGEDVNTVMYPDIIVKVVEYSPLEIRYESTPFYNISNLKRINLCLPESQVKPTSFCFNGNLLGSLGNVFIGGNQNTAGSTSNAALTRDGYSNYLDPDGIISVESSLAGFNEECMAWHGTIDMKGCMYDTSKSAAQNQIKWYTIEIRRKGTSNWEYVSQNYKHPKFSKRNLPGYTGDSVGPSYPNVGSLINNVPVYTNIQREIFADGVDWEFSNLDRYLRLSTGLYDKIVGVTTPGTFYVRIKGYTDTGTHVANATDLIALFIHNLNMEFDLTEIGLTDPAIVKDVCGLYRLTDAQMKTPMEFNFRAEDTHGFIDEYALRISRCPGTSIDLVSNQHGSFTLAGTHWFPEGTKPSNIHDTCPGYEGTKEDFYAGNVLVNIQPAVSSTGWIKAGEYFTKYTLYLRGRQRKTNGYNHGVTVWRERWRQILMERLTP